MENLDFCSVSEHELPNLGSWQERLRANPLFLARHEGKGQWGQLFTLDSVSSECRFMPIANA